MPASATTAKTKVCTRCKKRRKLDLFYKDKHMKDARSSWCKGCTKEYDREYTARKRAEKQIDVNDAPPTTQAAMAGKS